MMPHSAADKYIACLLTRTSGNYALTAILFRKLFSEVPQQLAEIEKNLVPTQLALAQEIAHKLHGSFSFCGLLEFQESAQNLEVELMSANLPLAKKRFLRLKRQINQFLQLQDEILTQLEQVPLK